MIESTPPQKSARRRIEVQQIPNSLQSRYLQPPNPKSTHHSLPKSTGTIKLKPQLVAKEPPKILAKPFYETSQLFPLMNISPK